MPPAQDVRTEAPEHTSTSTRENTPNVEPLENVATLEQANTKVDSLASAVLNEHSSAPSMTQKKHLTKEVHKNNKDEAIELNQRPEAWILQSRVAFGTLGSTGNVLLNTINGSQLEQNKPSSQQGLFDHLKVPVQKNSSLLVISKTRPRAARLQVSSARILHIRRDCLSALLVSLSVRCFSQALRHCLHLEGIYSVAALPNLHHSVPEPLQLQRVIFPRLHQRFHPASLGLHLHISQEAVYLVNLYPVVWVLEASEMAVTMVNLQLDRQRKRRTRSTCR